MRATDVRRKVTIAAQNRCGYCHSPQRFVMGKLEVEHIVPRSQGGGEGESNLWLSCALCNRYKGTQVQGKDRTSGQMVPLFNPRVHVWREHFHWSLDGTRILGRSSIGRVTVEALRLNNELAVVVRRNWVLAGWHPPGEDL